MHRCGIGQLCLIFWSCRQVLPVGAIVDGYFSDSIYDAAYQVSSVVDLMIQKARFQQLYCQIPLSQNYITTLILSLE